MSILTGLFDSDDEPKKEKDDEELLVFGYTCKLYRDDTKAIMEDSGQLLIPWMGDSSLMVDRYDVRNKLEDKNKFGLKPNISRVTAESRELEEELDKERYLALEWDEIRVEEQEEEEKKRRNNAFNAVGFTYDDPSADVTGLSYNLHLPEHPPSSSVDYMTGEKDKFTPPAGLVIPDGMQTPTTSKLHFIIEKTATFVSRQGTQMEIIIKTKQKFNPFFSFLNHGDELYPYYKHLKEMILIAAYMPQSRLDTSVDGGIESGGRGDSKKDDGVVIEEKTNGKAKEMENDPAKTSEGDASDGSKVDSGKDDDDDDDDDGGYLHPLLMAGSHKSPKPSTPEPAPTPKSKDTPKTTGGGGTVGKKLTMDELLQLHNTGFAAVNSAPTVHGSVSTHGQATSAVEEPEALAAYKYYQRQFYRSSAAMAAGQGEGYYYQTTDTSLPPHDAHVQQQLYGSESDDGFHHPGYAYPGHYWTAEEIPPPDLRPIVDKTAEYVAKNSDTFERTVLERHVGDPRFSFLNPWDKHHSYYQAMKHYCRTRMAQEGMETPPTMKEDKPVNVQKLSSSGTISFKLQSKPTAPVELVTPCSEFDAEEYCDELLESTAREAGYHTTMEHGNEKGQPPAKRHRFSNGDDPKGEDIMGNTVQAFLSTVKGLFGSSDLPT